MGVIYMRSIKKNATLILNGMKKNTFRANSDYTRHISSVAELNAESWYRTGTQLKSAMDKVGAKYAR